ncbi:transposase [Lysobacter firmicutimachus]|uniref:Transposase n=1 Tax=Lysobacter firmicutimachus TaxID=1792846 RepID=A0ABU8CZP4_9GAMM
MPSDPIKPRPFQLDDQQWRIVASYLPRQYQARILNNTGDYRAFIEAVLWVVHNNAPWTSIPGGFGSWRAVYVRFLRWVKDEHWIAVERALGLDSPLARGLRERVERYRANNLWRRRRGGVASHEREPGDAGELDVEIAKRWGLLSTG